MCVSVCVCVCARACVRARAPAHVRVTPTSKVKPKTKEPSCVARGMHTLPKIYLCTITIPTHYIPSKSLSVRELPRQRSWTRLALKPLRPQSIGGRRVMGERKPREVGSSVFD